jgi:hypothetical protein
MPLLSVNILDESEHGVLINKGDSVTTSLGPYDEAILF